MSYEKPFLKTDESRSVRDWQLRVAQRIARLGSWNWNVESDCVTWSEELCRIYGLEPGEFGESFDAFLEYVHPDDRMQVKDQISNTLRTGEPFDFEERIVRPDGTVRVLRSLGETSTDEEGRVIQLIGVCQDITEIKAAEAALHRANEELEHRVAARTAELARRSDELARAEQSFRAIVEASPVPLMLSRFEDGIIFYANERLEKLIGVAPGSLAGRKTPEFYYDLADRPHVLQTVREQGYVRDMELRIRRQDGTPRWVSLTVQKLTFEGDLALATALMDITERVETEQTLLLQKTLLEAQGEASIDGILVVAEDGSILSYNQRFAEMWNIPHQTLGKKSDEAAIKTVLDQLEDPEAFQDRIEYLYNNPMEVARDEIILRDGRVFDRYSAPVVSNQGDYYGRIWFFRDMTVQKKHAEEMEQSRLEAEKAWKQANRYASHLEQSLVQLQAAQDRLVHQEKLASLGRLTAGIAHEIKNPLNFVNNFAELSSELTDEIIQAFERGDDVTDLLSDLKHNTSKISKHGQRADAIVKNMMQHAAGIDGQRQLTDINVLVREYALLAIQGKQASSSGEDVDIGFELGEEVGALEIIPQEISRVLINLVDNAFDAVMGKKKTAGDRYRPSIKLSTRRRGDRVEIRVEDNGPGIPVDVRNRIFEPFFTTKPAGKGTGLGLSLAYDIITKGHEGRLTLESQNGKGAIFVISLPAT